MPRPALHRFSAVWALSDPQVPIEDTAQPGTTPVLEAG